MRHRAEHGIAEAVDLLEDLDSMEAFTKLRAFERECEVVGKRRQLLATDGIGGQSVQEQESHRSTGRGEGEGLDRLGRGPGAERRGWSIARMQGGAVRFRRAGIPEEATTSSRPSTEQQQRHARESEGDAHLVHDRRRELGNGLLPEQYLGHLEEVLGVRLSKLRARPGLLEASDDLGDERP